MDPHGNPMADDGIRTTLRHVARVWVLRLGHAP
jgi:hypothetical protein